MHPYAPDHGGDAGRDGLVDTGDDLGPGPACGQMGDDLRLSEDSTGARDCGATRGREGQLAKVGQIHLQCMGHHLQEAPSSSGALVIHHEVEHFAAYADGDALAILPADVNHGAHVGAEVVRAPGVAGDLGDSTVCAGNLHAAVASGDQPVNLLTRETCLRQRPVEHLERSRSPVVSGQNERRGE